MQLVKGNLFDTNAEVLLVTTNSYINARGELVMGRGAARQAANKWPHLPKQFAKYIEHLTLYGVLLIGCPYDDDYLMVGAFQVKDHWRNDANINLIWNSTMHLKQIAEAMPGISFAMNFPGTGNGRLPRDQVLPIIENLPDNVLVYEL